MMHCRRAVITAWCGHKEIWNFSFCYWMFWRYTQSNKIWLLGKFSITNLALIHFQVLKEKDNNSTLFTIFPDLFQAGKLEDFFKNSSLCQTLIKLWYFSLFFPTHTLLPFPHVLKCSSHCFLSASYALCTLFLSLWANWSCFWPSFKAKIAILTWSSS